MSGLNLSSPFSKFVRPQTQNIFQSVNYNLIRELAAFMLTQVIDGT